MLQMPNINTLPKDIANDISATRKQITEHILYGLAKVCESRNVVFWCGTFSTETDEQIA